MTDSFISPITASVTDIKVRKAVMTSRLREEQPAINAPAQDSIPGNGSGDQ
jgi:hypothetical protein